MICSANKNDRSFTARRLFPSTTYAVRVALNNNIGVGPYSMYNVTTTSPTGKQKFSKAYIIRVFAICGKEILGAVIFLGVHFVLNGMHYSNNCYVEITEVANGTGLLCVTNYNECCQNIEPVNSGTWSLSNKSLVTVDSSGVYVRGRKNTLVLKINNSTIISQGIFKCLVPVSESKSVAIFAGLYLTGQGMSC